MSRWCRSARRVRFRALPKPSDSPRRSALSSGVLTGLSIVALNGSAALAGILLARKFGRSAGTDGFMAAYGVYLVLVLGAQAFRSAVVPELTRKAWAPSTSTR